MKRTKPKLTVRQREAITRAIYLLKVAAFTDIVSDENEAEFDGTTCDGSCFKDDSRDAFETLMDVFGPFKMPEDTPKDDDDDAP